LVYGFHGRSQDKFSRSKGGGKVLFSKEGQGHRIHECNNIQQQGFNCHYNSITTTFPNILLQLVSFIRIQTSDAKGV